MWEGKPPDHQATLTCRSSSRRRLRGYILVSGPRLGLMQGTRRSFADSSKITVDFCVSSTPELESHPATYVWLRTQKMELVFFVALTTASALCHACGSCLCLLHLSFPLVSVTSFPPFDLLIVGISRAALLFICFGLCPLTLILKQGIPRVHSLHDKVPDAPSLTEPNPYTLFPHICDLVGHNNTPLKGSKETLTTLCISHFQPWC